MHHEILQYRHEVYINKSKKVNNKGGRAYKSKKKSEEIFYRPL